MRASAAASSLSASFASTITGLLSVGVTLGTYGQKYKPGLGLSKYRNRNILLVKIELQHAVIFLAN